MIVKWTLGISFLGGFRVNEAKDGPPKLTKTQASIFSFFDLTSQPVDVEVKRPIVDTSETNSAPNPSNTVVFPEHDEPAIHTHSLAPANISEIEPISSPQIPPQPGADP